MPKYLKYIFSIAWQQKNRVIAAAALLVFSVAARLTEPYLYKVIVDTLTAGLIDASQVAAQTDTLVTVIGCWFALSVALNLAQGQMTYLVWKIGNIGSSKVHMDGYRRVLTLDYAKHLSEHSSRYAKIVDDAETSVWDMTNWWLNRFASAILGFIGMLAIALSVSWQMTLIAVSVIPPTIWFIVHRINKYAAEQRHIDKLWKAKNEHLSDQIGNIITYKLNPHEDLFVERHNEFSEAALHAQMALNQKWRTTEILNPDALARFLVLGTGIFFVRDGSITLGTLFMFMGLLNEILIPLHLLGDIMPQYTRKAQQIDHLIALLEEKDVMTAPETPAAFSTISGTVAFEHVSFAYAAEGGFGLKDISFSITPGQTVAMVGHSGSGKTTTMSLLSRLVDPTEGRITIDGIDLRDFEPAALKMHVGTVLQENAMYNETIAENIAYGDPRASREQIVAAATQAHAAGFIEKMPKQYDTVIGERGVRLSGGEKQRIAIARAILKNPSIVVLDEPTSALDSLTEREVQRGLNELMKGKTTLIIAHRLSTVRHSDIILVLENGRIIGQGPHEELMKSCPTYKSMVDLQTEGFLADQ